MFDGILRGLRRKPRVIQARFDITGSGEPEIRFPGSLKAAKLSRAQRMSAGIYEFETEDSIGSDSSGRRAIDNIGATYGTVGVTNEDLQAQWDFSATATQKVVLIVRLKAGTANADPASGGRLSIWIHYDGAP